jgi:nitrogen-specific signal transduction histidine kinase/CheY-like chemotaxis protein
LRDRDGRHVGAYQFVYDVTERLRDQERLRKAEDALRHAQKLESLGQLTGGVAHDFNNLLAVFANGLQLLERNVGEVQRQRVFEGMRRAIARGSGLTHHLLAFSRRRPFNSDSIDLSAQLHGMRELLERSLRGDIDVEMRFHEGLWPVEVDVGEFELAVLNLCLNARDAMTGGGTIRITATNRHKVADLGPASDCVELTVTDTGSGMPPEVLARVFEPFFTTKDAGKGSGLGLPQVYGFAQQSGGKLTIDSAPGAGTTVTLLLPRSLREPTASREPQVATGTSIRTGIDHGTLLLVEDDNEVAALTREMLSCLGFKVIHATTPAAALGALANGRPVDVVLSDIMMPGGMSGLDLAREIRRRKPGLPVVLTTGYAEAAAGMEPREFKLLLKPYSIEALSAALEMNEPAHRRLVRVS